MKKMFTLSLSLLLAVALMAADHRPVVTISSSKNFKVVIDGRSYFGADMTISLDHLRNGPHTISIYEMKKGWFQNREILLSSRRFFLSGNDVMIRIDWYGNISIKERNKHRRFYDRNDDDRYDRNDRDRDNRNFRRDDDDNDRRF